MMITTEQIDIEVCVDCLTIEANGPDEVEPAAVERFARAMESATADGWTYANACPEECEGHFSWSPCDFCGSTLGGDRHPAALLRREAR